MGIPVDAILELFTKRVAVVSETALYLKSFNYEVNHAKANR
jgi:hypothetical protein